MTGRPTITPDTLAAIISAAPDRLQKKLDRDPRAADAWEWTEANGVWMINAGEETVCISSTVVSEVTHVKCSCLLSPRCFHVLTVVSVIEIADADSEDGHSWPSSVDTSNEAFKIGADTGESTTLPEPANLNSARQQTLLPETRPRGEVQSLTEVQQHAARLMYSACAGILVRALRAAGALLQSRLLRAIHECRSEGLHRIAAGGLRLMNNLRLLRGGDDQFSSTAAEIDFCEVLEACVRLQCRRDPLSGATPVSLEWIGIARRHYEPFGSLKLHALFCEPILTRSGYSGVVTWLISDDGWIGSVSDVQPGGVKRIPQAWQSGVSLAGLSISHRDLSQKCLLISKATRSVDGRLGGGDSARAVAIEGQGWDAPSILSKFQVPLSDQVRTAFSQQSDGDFLQPAGTDLVFLTAVVGGFSGQELVVREVESRTILRLAIAIDDDGVAFRSSLQTLSRAPGLVLRFIGRIDFAAAGRIQPLAVAPAVMTVPDVATGTNTEEPDRPALRLTNTVQVASIGLEEVTRSHLSCAESQPVAVPIVDSSGASSLMSHYDDSLERWLRAIVVGGRHAIPQGLVTGAVRDAARLKFQLRPAAASMLQSLTQSTIATMTEVSGIRFSESPEVLATKWIAGCIGNRAATKHLQLKEWMLQLEPAGQAP